MKMPLFVLVIALIAVACTDFTTDKELLTGLKQDVEYLASDDLEGRAIGTDGEVLAARYIADKFKEIGLKPKGTDKYFQVFRVNKPTNPHEQAVIGTNGEGIAGRNVVGFIDNGKPFTIVLGAHYDHLGYGSEGSLYRGEPAIHNGADDNASGTAALIQLARILKEKKSDYNYLFIAFSGEENGLWGSNYFSKNATVAVDSLNFMINMDMVGRLNKEKSLAINGVGTSPVWKDVLNEINYDSLKLVTSESGVGPSDHTSFYLQDIPVLHFFTGQHEDYHKPSDDADKINYEGMVKVIRFIERLMGELDSKEKLEFTKTQDNSGDSPRFTVTLGVVPDYLYDGEGMRLDGVTDGKPAAMAGMQKGDVVIKMGDSTIVDMMSYMRALSAFTPGDETTVHYKRGDQISTVKVKF
ncbi:M28 family peptidase [Roseivirga sp. UBA838]|uniref:M28 family peptidase n=1 Tax=Roseivirga sp. UBA838 TaxID=1947393 RepID=UPI002579B903|nr:M28 family peptidase [Roseivirga sp. UBA838]|tara:strand:+ start:13023 stop:14255 length:1233 start_codon:yes stop_codon:yes gene_type:complete